MAQDKLHPQIDALCKMLDSVAVALANGFGTNNAVMSDTWGWNFPSINRDGLIRAVTGLASELRERSPDTLDVAMVELVKEWQSNIEKLKTKTLQYLWNGNGAQAAPAYLVTLSQLREDLEPLIGWQGIQDSNLLPPKLARRLRAYQAKLDEIAPDQDELTRRIKLIGDATEAAESLPTDLAELTAARTKIQRVDTDTALLHEKIAERLKEAESSSKTIATHEGEAEKLVAKCEEAYQITTTKGLAAAFDERSLSLNISMWAWVFILLGALGVGYFLGKERLAELSTLLTAAQERKVPVWPEVFLAIISLGGPIWLAWIATKQIGQRFRLAEDYAYKAAVSKAYEGYKKAAVGIDEALEARLFAAALTRLEEAPLRLVEGATHGSPWHEFLESPAFHKAMEIVPGFRDQFKQIGQRIAGKKANGEGESTADAAKRGS